MSQTMHEHKPAVQFPGQGAQKVGMGEDLYNREPLAEQTFDRANEQLGYDLADVCFNGPEERLTETRHSQPAIFVTSLAFYRVLQEKLDEPIEPAATAGLSLGEYTALVAAGALRFDDALKVVQVRARAMQDACDERPGGMRSIMGMDRKEVEAVCEELQDQGIIDVANVNAPNQIVISGEEDVLDQAEDVLEERGAGRIVPLKVAGAFHSRLMEPAAEAVKSALADVEIRPPRFPVIANVTGMQVRDPDDIRRRLVQQLTSSVLWAPSIQTMVEEMGIGAFLEVGPGRVLSSLALKVSRDIETLNIQSVEDLDEFLAN
jgi:[acyl-carrier-protein] S-malonyltransferase